ncbi:hypothetical protein D3C80_1570300 [compost metagenome]
MNPKRICARLKHLICNGIKCSFWILVINANPAFHRDRHRNNLFHGRNATRNDIRCLHQAGAERSRLNAIRRTSDIQIDFVITETFADACRFLQF